MPAPLAIPIVARVVLYGVVAGTVAAVGWMIKEIYKDDEKQRERRIRERDEDESNALVDRRGAGRGCRIRRAERLGLRV